MRENVEWLRKRAEVVDKCWCALASFSIGGGHGAKRPEDVEMASLSRRSSNKRIKRECVWSTVGILNTKAHL